jgi:hypothetical protein
MFSKRYKKLLYRLPSFVVSLCWVKNVTHILGGQVIEEFVSTYHYELVYPICHWEPINFLEMGYLYTFPIFQTKTEADAFIL